MRARTYATDADTQQRLTELVAGPTPPKEERKAIDPMHRSRRRLLGAVRARIAALEREERAG
jgi:hypothetical protein